MPAHEQSVADEFNRYLGEHAARFGMMFKPFALSGQDRDAAADYLVTTASRFSLIEFKYRTSNIRDESAKWRRRKLCVSLEKNSIMRRLHDMCHYLVWLDTRNLQPQTNVYRHEVCNQSIFGVASGLKAIAPTDRLRMTAEEFSADFFNSNSPHGLSLADFEKYLVWLMVVTSGGPNSTLELMCRDEGSSIFSYKVFSSVREASNWLYSSKT
jgi:hypothetical protein